MSGIHLYNTFDEIKVTAIPDFDLFFNNLFVQQNPIFTKPASDFSVPLKNDFNLGRQRKTTREKKNITLNGNELQTTLAETSLRQKLVTWFCHQNKFLKTYHRTPIYLSLGILKSVEGNFGVLSFPVHLCPVSENEFLAFMLFGSDFYYNGKVIYYLKNRDIALPPLPEKVEDVHIKTLWSDIKSNLVGAQDLQLLEAVKLAVYSEPFYYTEPDSMELKGANQHAIHVVKKSYTTAERIKNASVFRDNLFPYSISDIDLLDAYKRNVHIHLERDTNDYETESQAIQCIIEQALKNKQKILCVSEKGELFQQVFLALKEKQLHHNIFDVSKASNRKHFMKQLSVIMDTNWALHNTDPSELSPYDFTRIVQNELHDTDYDALSIIRNVEQLKDAYSPVTSFDNATEYTRFQIEIWAKKLPRLALLHEKFGDHTRFSWSDLTYHFEPDNQIQINVTRLIRKILDSLLQIEELSEKMSKKVGLKKPATLADIATFCNHIDYVTGAPHILPEQLKVNWLEEKKNVENIFELLEKAKKYREIVHEYFMTDIIQEPLTEIEPRLRRGRNTFFRYLNWRYRKDLERVTKHTIIPTTDKDEDFWIYLTHARIYIQLRNKIKEVSDKANAYFGDYWKGVNSDIDECKKLFKWLVDFTRYRKRHKIKLTPSLKRTLVSRFSFKSEELKKLDRLRENIENAKNILLETLPFNEDSMFFRLSHIDFNSIIKNLKNRLDDIPQLPEYHNYVILRKSVDDNFVLKLIEEVQKEKELSYDDLPDIFKKSYYNALIQQIAERETHDPEIINSDCKSAIEALNDWETFNLKKLQTTLNDYRKELLDPDHEGFSQLKILQHELKKQNRYASSFNIISKTNKAFSRYAPVWFTQSYQLERISDYINQFDIIIVTNSSINKAGKIAALSNASPQFILISERDKLELKWPNTTSVPLFYSITYKHSRVNPIFKAHSFSTELHHTGQPSSQPTVVPDSTINEILKHTKANEYQFIWLPDKKTELQFWEQFVQLASGFTKLAFESYTFIHQLPESIVQSDLTNTTIQAARTSYLFFKTEQKDAASNPFMLSNKNGDYGNHYNPSSVYDVTERKINLFGENSAALDAFETEIKQIKNGRPGFLEKMQQQLISEFCEDWHIHIHPENPFECILKHKKIVPMSIYVWSDVYADNRTSPFVKYLQEIKPSFTDMLYFPYQYYPDHLDEWFQYAHNEIETILENQQEKNRNLIELSLQKAAEKQEQANSQISLIKPKSKSKANAEQETAKKLTSEVPVNQGAPQIPELDKLPALPPYKFHDDLLLGTKNDLMKESSRQIQKLILDVVEVESPIHWQNLTRCIASYYQVQEIDDPTKSRIVENIDNLIENGEIYFKDDCLYNEETFTFKLRDRSDSIEFHRPGEIPPDEGEAALFEILQYFHPVTMEELIRAGTRYLGFYNEPDKLRKMLLQRLKLMGKNGHVVHGDSGFELNSTYYD